MRSHLLFSRKFLLTVFLVIGCGGGGGGSDALPSDPTLSNDVCSTLGLKVFSGSACDNIDRSPVVAVYIETLGGTNLCSGSLISPRHVLTAGHCFRLGSATPVAVSVQAEGREIGARTFTVHPGYEERNDLAAIFNDAAIVELNDSIDITPLPLLLSRSPQVGDVINIFGYGLDEAGGLGTLKSGQMRLSEVTTTHLFALFGGDGSNTCVGDSGGPAFESAAATQAIVGITSTGSAESLCRAGDNSLFTNIQASSVLDFISQQVPGVGGV